MQESTPPFEAPRVPGRPESLEQTLPTMKIERPVHLPVFDSSISFDDGPESSDMPAPGRALVSTSAAASQLPGPTSTMEHVAGALRPRGQRRFAYSLLMNAWEEELAGLCETLDISEVGMRVRRVGGTRRRLRSTELVLEFQLPDSKELFRIPAIRERTDDGGAFFARFVGSPERVRTLTGRLTSTLTRLVDVSSPTGAYQVAPASHRTGSYRAVR